MSKKKFITILILCCVGAFALIFIRAYQNFWSVPNLNDPIILYGMGVLFIITAISFAKYRKTFKADSKVGSINKTLFTIYILVAIIHAACTFFGSYDSTKSDIKIKRILFRAETNKNTKKVMRILEKYPYLCNAPDDQGRTLLHTASGRGDIERMKFLITHNANIESQDYQGSTPLNWAVDTGNLEAVKYLIGCGANVDTRRKSEFGQITPIFTAIIMGHKDVVKLLISNGADINIRNDRGHTPLTWAQVKEQDEIAELLRQHGAIE